MEWQRARNRANAYWHPASRAACAYNFVTRHARGVVQRLHLLVVLALAAGDGEAASSLGHKSTVVAAPRARAGPDAATSAAPAALLGCYHLAFDPPTFGRSVPMKRGQTVPRILVLWHTVWSAPWRLASTWGLQDGRSWSAAKWAAEAGDSIDVIIPTLHWAVNAIEPAYPDQTAHCSLRHLSGVELWATRRRVNS
jgi:hypothetical protein